MDLGTIVLCFFVLAFIITPSTIWLIYTIKLKLGNKKAYYYANLSGLIIVWFLLTFFVFQIFPGSNAYFSKKRIMDLTGLEIKAKKNVVYDSFGGFQGDGYTIMQFDLKGELPIVDLTTLNKPKNIGSKWKSFDWKATPILSQDSIYISYLLAEKSNNSDSIQLAKVFKVITEVLKSEGGFYTYSCDFRNDGSWYGINFYIISIKKRILVTINSQT